MSLSLVKNHLNNLSKSEAIGIISELYNKFDNVKEYLDYFINPQEDKLLEKYKKIINDEFMPLKGFGKARIAIAKKAISDFKKFEPSETDIADLMLYYIKIGTEFQNEFGGDFEKLYDSLESTFESTLKLMRKINALEKFKERCIKIIKDTEDTGYGFGDIINELFIEYYGDAIINQEFYKS